jgi:hypothetical protein
MSFPFGNESALDTKNSKEVTVHDVMRGRYPDTANARADAEQAVNLFFDALLRRPGLERGRL